MEGITQRQAIILYVGGGKFAKVETDNLLFQTVICQYLNLVNMDNFIHRFKGCTEKQAYPGDM